jgi:hypothetical protein
MIVDNTKKARKLMTAYQQDLRADDSLSFLLAICHVKLDDFLKAQILFEKSCVAMFNPPMWWKGTSQPNWLVDICVLSGRKDLYLDVIRELNAYKKDPRGVSFVAVYSYSLMELLLPSNGEIQKWIEGLFMKPKWRDAYAMGQSLQSIVNGDQYGLNKALIDLLKAHEGMAKHGGLRETAEGLLCMPAMSLAYVGRRRNLEIEIENDYFSNGYLEFLLNRTGYE